MASTTTIQQQQYVKLNTGASMPLVGLGTYKAPPGEVAQVVAAALRNVYRHLDCAEIYGNEPEIGHALKEAFDQGVITREELFVTSKVFNQHHTPERVLSACRNTLKNLQLSYLDLYLIHWPVKFEDEEIALPMMDENNVLNPLIKAEFEYLETWKAMEGLLKEGLVKAIGVSNFTVEQLEELSRHSEIVPATNQVEFHPYLNQTELLEYCKSKGIVVTAYSSLGAQLQNSPSLLKDEVIVSVANQTAKSPAQVLLRWALQTGVNVIPKSVSAERLRQNLDVFDFELNADQMKAINALHHNYRFNLGWLPGHYLPNA